MEDDELGRSREETIGAPAAGTDGSVESNGGVPSFDEVLKALSNSRRRAILYHVRDEQVATVDELARHVVAGELDVLPENVPADRHEQAMSDLVHVHLPQLVDALCIEYDLRSQTVTYADPPRLIDKTLEVLARLERERGE